MSHRAHPERSDDISQGHPTTRRGFITGLGFGVVSLYGVWAAYGAAPTSLSFLSFLSNDGGEGGQMAGMGGHMAGGGMDPEEFRRLTEEFIEANELPDGSVKPRSQAMASLPKNPDHAGEGEPVRHAASRPAAEQHGADDRPIEVYMMASRYGYAPDVLRIERNVPYRFRIMAVDADHGMSIKLRLAGYIIRCPARTLVEKTMMFTRTDEYLVYCTVYCGEGHDLMMGKIIVA
jgi:hypothetical protein